MVNFMSQTARYRDANQQPPHRVVTEISQLYELTEWPALLTKSTPIVLRVPEINEESALSLQSLINRHLSACGCAEGAVFLLIGACGYIVYVFVTGAAGSPLGWSTLWMGLGVTCIAAMLGKLAGLVRSQLLLAGLIRHWLVSPSSTVATQFHEQPKE